MAARRAGEVYSVAIHSAPLVLATTMTDGTGTFSVAVCVPEGCRGGSAQH